jgi:hypothetical protein
MGFRRHLNNSDADRALSSAREKLDRVAERGPAVEHVVRALQQWRNEYIDNLLDTPGEDTHTT